MPLHPGERKRVERRVFKAHSVSNARLSKVYLCQLSAHEILDLPRDEASRAADAAHARWLLHPKLSYWSWSD
jgi:hypothetical protein